jgi:hypothetical protein
MKAHAGGGLSRSRAGSPTVIGSDPHHPQRPAAELSHEREHAAPRGISGVRELVRERARERPIASACMHVLLEVRRSIAVPLPFPESGRLVVAHTNADAR